MLKCRPFVVVRHTGREQLASIRSAQATAKAEGVDPSPIDSVLHLVPQVTYLGEDLERTKFDDILDLDGDDLDALFEVFAPSGCVEGPPSPSS